MLAFAPYVDWPHQTDYTNFFIPICSSLLYVFILLADDILLLSTQFAVSSFHTSIPFFVKALLSSEELASVPFLVLGNKIDLGRASSEEDLRHQLGLYETYGKEVIFHCECSYVTMQSSFSRILQIPLCPLLTSFCSNPWYLSHICNEDSFAFNFQLKSGKQAGGVRPVELYMCSVVRKMGYGDGELLFHDCFFVWAFSRLWSYLSWTSHFFFHISKRIQMDRAVSLSFSNLRNPAVHVEAIEEKVI